MKYSKSLLGPCKNVDHGVIKWQWCPAILQLHFPCTPRHVAAEMSGARGWGTRSCTHPLPRKPHTSDVSVYLKVFTPFCNPGLLSLTNLIFLCLKPVDVVSHPLMVWRRWLQRRSLWQVKVGGWRYQDSKEFNRSGFGLSFLDNQCVRILKCLSYSESLWSKPGLTMSVSWSLLFSFVRHLPFGIVDVMFSMKRTVSADTLRRHSTAFVLLGSALPDTQIIFIFQVFHGA